MGTDHTLSFLGAFLRDQPANGHDSIMSIVDTLDKLSDSSKAVLERAKRIAVESNSRYVGAIHILLAFDTLNDNELAKSVLPDTLGNQYKKQLIHALKNNPAKGTQKVKAHDTDAKRTLLEADEAAKEASGDSAEYEIKPEHLLMGLIEALDHSPNGWLNKVVADLKVNLEDLKDQIKDKIDPQNGGIASRSNGIPRVLEMP